MIDTLQEAKDAARFADECCDREQWDRVQAYSLLSLAFSAVALVEQLVLMTAIDRHTENSAHIRATN